VKTKLKLLRP